MKAIRFWAYLDAPVLIKIHAGQFLSHNRTTKHDEGFTRITHDWIYDGELLSEVYHSYGRDCDGLHGYSSRRYCRPDRVRAGHVENDVVFPAWVDGEAAIYDEYAEAANY